MSMNKLNLVLTELSDQLTEQPPVRPPLPGEYPVRDSVGSQRLGQWPPMFNPIKRTRIPAIPIQCAGNLHGKRFRAAHTQGINRLHQPDASGWPPHLTTPALAGYL